MLAPKSNESPLHYWISLWPTAPLFGVAWRFEALSPMAAFFRPGEVVAQMTEASAHEATRTIEETVEHAAHEVEAAAGLAETELRAAASAFDAPEAAADTIWDDDAPAPERPAALFDAPPAEIDDLKQIKGVGPKLEETLNAMGVYRFDQIAGFTEANLAWIDANLTTFRGRPLRDDWAAQARALLGA